MLSAYARSALLPAKQQWGRGTIPNAKKDSTRRKSTKRTALAQPQSRFITSSSSSASRSQRRRAPPNRRGASVASQGGNNGRGSRLAVKTPTTEIGGSNHHNGNPRFRASQERSISTGFNSQQSMSQLTMDPSQSQDFASVASTRRNSNSNQHYNDDSNNNNHDDHDGMDSNNKYVPPPRQESLSISSRSGTMAPPPPRPHQSFQASAAAASQQGSRATNRTAFSNSSNSNKSRSSSQVSFAPNIASSRAPTTSTQNNGRNVPKRRTGPRFQGQETRMIAAQQQPTKSNNKPRASSQEGSITSIGFYNPNKRRNASIGTWTDHIPKAEASAFHQSNYKSGFTTTSNSNHSVSNKSLSKSKRSDGSSATAVSETQVKTLVEEAVDIKLNQLHANMERMLDERLSTFNETVNESVKESVNERLSTADDLHLERIQELESKKKQIDKKATKVATMLKVAEGTVAKVSRIAETTIASIDQARTDLVESALPYLKHPVAKLVEVLFGELAAAKATTTQDSHNKTLASPSTVKTDLSALEANKTVVVTGEYKDKATKQKRGKIIASKAKKESKRTVSKKKKPSKTSLPSSKPPSSAGGSKRMFSPDSKARFKPLVLVNASSTAKSTDELVDNVISFPKAKSKQSCVTPCEKGSLQASVDYDFSSQDMSSCTASPAVVTKKRRASASQPTKRGRTQKARNTYGGANRSRDNVLNDISFL